MVCYAFCRLKEKYLSSQGIKRLPLEDMAKQMLNAIATGNNTKMYKLEEISQVAKALEFLESNDYLKLTGGTPKSGPGYKVTEKGREYLKK